MEPGCGELKADPCKGRGVHALSNSEQGLTGPDRPCLEHPGSQEYQRFTDFSEST